MYWTIMSDPAILTLLGERLAALRLRKNISQEELALNSGVSISTISRIERGSKTTTDNLIKIMRTLDILENLDGLIPEQPISPIQMKKMQGGKRKRASGKF
ncbi:helix-turn-helix domain-containing protein [Bacteroides sp. 51]|uniref:helix-turn-helix domain-containing protein n=1 Tax=Bacteroides sp. 51 TaxID=2302938 RepID=UPI0013D08709|nr:helix-turn-helix transcriptional regulator [Bacteroides sp. 51]NDV83385.1 XRE family transcriptional regulator [Bacteroides sp. 51]